MRHYIHITANYVAKNKAHEDAAKLARNYHRKLVKSDSDLSKAKAEIKSKLDEINSKYPRIKNKAEFSVFQGSPKSSAAWHLGESVILTIEPIVCDLEYDIHE